MIKCFFRAINLLIYDHICGGRKLIILGFHSKARIFLLVDLRTLLL